MTEKVQEYLTLNGMDAYLALFGANERNLSLLEGELGVTLSLRGSEIRIEGEAENAGWARQVLEKLMELEERHTPIDRTTLRYACALVKEGGLDRLDELAAQVVAITHRGRPVRCKTLGQYDYVKAIREHELTFAVGPAGTGNEMMGAESYQRLQERGALEVAPLAYMRGRTLSDSFIILDEAQNTTPEQMKMFLTRFGAGSRVVVTGDATQTDLPYGKQSGLLQALEVLKDIPELAIIRLSQSDVVRHDLVQTVVKAYEAYERNRGC